MDLFQSLCNSMPLSVVYGCVVAKSGQESQRHKKLVILGKKTSSPANFPLLVSGPIRQFHGEITSHKSKKKTK